MKNIQPEITSAVVVGRCKWLLALVAAGATVMSCSEREAGPDGSLQGSQDAGAEDAGTNDNTADAGQSAGDASQGEDAAMARVICPGVSDPAKVHLYWGDLHVHTNYSLDAYWFNDLQGPDEAFQYAKGDLAAGFPLDDPTVAAREERIDLPLDFTAVTDHSEFLGFFKELCDDAGPGLSGTCDTVGSFVRDNVDQLVSGESPLSGSEAQMAIPTAAAWQNSVTIAENHNVDCQFTAFPGYEFTPQPGGGMIHRNVIMMGDEFPEDVVSSIHAADEWVLFERLEAECRSTGRCDFLTIPHNSNMSDGKMFPPEFEDGLPAARSSTRTMTAEDAAMKARNDSAVEMVQHKGQSECMPGGAFDMLGGEEQDELCAFERIKPICNFTEDDPIGCRSECRPGRVDIGEDPSAPADCTTPQDFVRITLADGLRIKERLGVNPYQMGFVGATDTHNGTPGNVAEKTFRGHGGVLDSTPDVLLGKWTCEGIDCDPSYNLGAYRLNGGGVTAVWAPQNTRRDIFEAIRDKKTYATSGPRIHVRSFATWDQFPGQGCARLRGDMERRSGPFDTVRSDTIAMGGTLPERPDGAKPSIMVFAQKAVETGGEMGTPLNRIQIIKGWVEPDGTRRAQIIHLDGQMGSPDQLPQPGPACQIDQNAGSDTLCGVWRDDAFDGEREVYYYARVVENPSCRWSTWMCRDRGVDCSQLNAQRWSFPARTGFAGYEGCCEAGPDGTPQERVDFVQERAWTSPFWYER